MKVEDEWESVEEWEARGGNVFREVDKQWVQPYLASVLSSSSSPSHRVSTLDVLQSCHNNETLYNIARLSSVYDVTNLQQWREHYNMDQIERKLDIRPLRGLQLINSDTKSALQFLSKSQLTRLDLVCRLPKLNQNQF